MSHHVISYAGGDHVANESGYYRKFGTNDNPLHAAKDTHPTTMTGTIAVSLYAPFYSIIYYTILFYFILYYSILFYAILFYTILIAYLSFHSLLNSPTQLTSIPLWLSCVRLSHYNDCLLIHSPSYLLFLSSTAPKTLNRSNSMMGDRIGERKYVLYPSDRISFFTYCTK